MLVYWLIFWSNFTIAISYSSLSKDGGLPWWVSSKESVCNARAAADTGPIPGLGRFPWRRVWKPTPVFFSGEPHEQRTLASYNPWGRKELDMTEATRWTWVSVNYGSWWWTGRPGVLRFMGWQRVGHDWATDLIWSDLIWSNLARTLEIVVN